MKLKSLNCKNCGSPMREINGMLHCDMCGSDFSMEESQEAKTIDHMQQSVEKERARCAQRLTPAIIPIPSVRGSLSTGRQRLSSFVEQAVGSDIIFNN